MDPVGCGILSIRGILGHAAGYSYVQRRIRRTVWFALLAVLALTLPAVQPAAEPSLRVGMVVAVMVLVVASWSIVLQVSGYVGRERLRLRTAAEHIDNRVSNYLSLTVGYTEFLADNKRLPEDAREQARMAMEGAHKAADAVKDFKRGLGWQGDDYAPTQALSGKPLES